MNCCTNCFQANGVVAFIESEGTQGNCDFCMMECVKILPAEELGNTFDPLLELYEPDVDQGFHIGRSLADALAEWNVFNAELPIQTQNKILDEIRFGTLDDKDRSITRCSSERWQFKDAFWEEDIWAHFSNHIKERRRFILGKEFSDFFTEPRVWLPDILSESEMTINPTKVFHRAREGCSVMQSKQQPFPASQMGSPPSAKARRGRANPAGISYLYVAEEPETAVAEIRPFVGALVSVCSIKAKKPLRVADITRIHTIQNPFGQGDLKSQIRRNALLNILNRELARPVNPEDSEIEYVPTQYLAEAILDFGYDGIRYKSAVRQGGKNFVFFEPSELEIDPHTMLVRVESIEVQFSSH